MVEHGKNHPLESGLEFSRRDWFVSFEVVYVGKSAVVIMGCAL